MPENTATAIDLHSTVEVAPYTPVDPEGACHVCCDADQPIVIMDLGQPTCATCWCRNCGTPHGVTEPCAFEVVDPFEFR